MRLILVRHGETVENVKKINQGHLPGTLTGRGIEQARSVAKRLKNEKIDLVYSSDLARAKETTRIILKEHPNTTVIYTPALRERDFGVFEGTPHGSIREYVKNKGLDFITFKPELGESIEETKQRTIRFYNEILQKHSQETILWVTHGGIIVNLLLHLKGWGDERYKEVIPENTAVTIVYAEPGKTPLIKVENDIEHETNQNRACQS